MSRWKLSEFRQALESAPKNFAGQPDLRQQGKGGGAAPGPKPLPRWLPWGRS